MSGVTVVTVDLSKAVNQVIAPPGVSVATLTVLAMPSGLVLPVTTRDSQVFPLYFITQTQRFCPTVDDGLTALVPAGLAGTITIALNMETGGTPPGSAPPGFIGGIVITTAASTGAECTILQLQNPPTSGKLVNIRAITSAYSVGGFITGHKTLVIRGGVIATTTVSKMSAFAPTDPVALLRGLTHASKQTTQGIFQYFGGTSLQAKLGATDLGNNPIQLSPGENFEIEDGGGVSGASFGAGFVWDWQ